MIETNFDPHQTQFLVSGFRDGFDLGYRGPKIVKQHSPNLKFVVGNKTELWNKVMKEVQLKRFVGPFKQIPFENFIQSPIGLVPKDGGKKTRLIFHLSYPRGSNSSVNANTPDELSKVSYQNFSHAIQLCLEAGKGCFAGKSDLTSAFRHLCIHKKFWQYLVMKAVHPTTGEVFFFVDKCMPFGSSISCANFQMFSDALSHIIKTKTGTNNINYLDDFFFVALLQALCNKQISVFLDVCSQINFPVSLDKTFWGSTRITFLGLLIDTVQQKILIPIDKVERVVNFILFVLHKPNKKITLKQLQQLCGHLNFLCNAIIPGRAFTRRIYAHGAGLTKPNHHLNVTKEVRLDLEMWYEFLTADSSVYNRPFFDLGSNLVFDDIKFATDASANPLLGAGGTCGAAWFILQWNEDFILQQRPSINYLELFAVTVGIFAWLGKDFQNRNLTLFCDNQSVVYMLNSNASKCKNCMILIRKIVLHNIRHNIRLRLKYVESKRNRFLDLLSRHKYKQFRREARQQGIKFNNKSTEIPNELWPMEKLWTNRN